jgi:hypothetical protein
MDPRFLPYVEHLHAKTQALVSMLPVTPVTLPRLMSKRGVYLLSEGERHLYVGRINDIRKRLAPLSARRYTSDGGPCVSASAGGNRQSEGDLQKGSGHERRWSRRRVF